MRRSGSKLCLIAMITATATLTACAPKGGSKRESQKIPSFRMMKIQSTPRLT